MSADVSISPGLLSRDLHESGMQHCSPFALSAEARTVAIYTHEAVQQITSSFVLYGTKSAAISELWSAFEECNFSGWDGYDAEPVDGWAVKTAVRFVQVLPPGIPKPEVTPESDGSIALDWSVSRHQILSVSFGTGMDLAYAWLDGNERGRGVVRFDGENVPRRINKELRSMLNIA